MDLKFLTVAYVSMNFLNLMQSSGFCKVMIQSARFLGMQWSSWHLFHNVLVGYEGDANFRSEASYTNR